jgi:iron-sulfur cluster repair protein YtfE (RIC family)
MKEARDMADFFAEFRSDHRFVLRTLVDLRKAVDAGDLATARQLLDALDGAAGPHMEFEERFLYPFLIPLLGEERVKALISDHQGAAEMLHRAKEIARKDALTEEDCAFLHEFIREFLQHAADCEGTGLLAEALPSERLQEFGKQIVALRATGKPLTVYKGVAETT